MLRRHLHLAAALVAMLGLGGVGIAGDDAKKPANVDRHGDALPDGAAARMGTTRFRHGDNINFLGFPSDNTVLTAARDGSVRLWERATGKEIRRFQPPAVKAAPLDPQAGGMMFMMGSGRGGSNRIALSPDGKIFATALADNSIQLWDVETGKEMRRLKAPTSGVADLLFSPDAKNLAVAGNDRSIRVIKTDNGDDICQLKAMAANGPVRLAVGVAAGADVTGLAFSPNGKILADAEIEFGQQKATLYLRLTKIESGEQLSKTEMQNGVASIAFSPDGKLIAHGSEGAIVLRDAATAKEIRTIKNGPRIARLLFSPDGKILAAKGRDQVVRLFDVETGKSLHQLGQPATAGQPIGNVFFIAGPSLGSETRDFAFSRDGKTIGVGGGQAPRLYDVATGKEEPLAGGHRSRVSTLGISRDGKTLISRGADRVIRRWNAQTGEELGQFNEPAGTTTAAISPDGKLIAIANSDGSIRVLSAQTGDVVHKVKGHPNGLASLAFSADSKLLASRGLDNAIRVIELAKGGEIRAITIASEGQPMGDNVIVFGAPRQVAPVQALVFSPDGAAIASCADGSPNVIRTWDIATGKQARQIKLPHNCACLAYSPDGRLIAADNGAGTVTLWEIASGKQRALVGEPAAPPSQPGAMAGGGLVVVGGGFGGPVRSAAPAGPSFAFSPDGSLLATRGPGNSVRIWDVATAKQAGQFKGHAGEVTTLAFAPDGKSVASGSSDTTILVWELKGIKRQAGEPVPLAAEQLQSLWADLAGGDAAKAGQAVRTLAAGAKDSIPFLAGRLKPAPAVDPKKIEQWVADLDSSSFPKRTQAAQEIAKLGELAKPALKKVLDAEPSPEMRRRVEPLLEKLITGSLTPEQLQTARAIEALERANNAEARSVLEGLTKGAAGALPTREAEAALVRMKASASGR